jgi:hypothetical protein
MLSVSDNTEIPAKLGGQNGVFGMQCQGNSAYGKG